MNRSYIFWFAFLLCVTLNRYGMCDSEQNDEPIDDDDDYDYLEESSEANRNSTDTLTPSSDIANDTSVSSAINVTTVETTTPLAAVSNTVKTLTSTTHKPFECPANCRCSSVFHYVDCSHQQLTDIPKTLPIKMVRLDLSYNQLTSVNLSHLIDCIYLRELILSNNQIENIHGNAAIVKLSHLDHIDLSTNALKPLHGNEFHQARSLTHLILANNTNIIEASTAFASNSLHTLNLFNCNIVTLPERIFQNLTSLISLDLRQNPLDLSSNVVAFKSLKHLRTLKMPTLDKSIFKGLCETMDVIDIINMEKDDLSCYLLTNGLPYDESTFKAGKTTIKPGTEDDYIVTHPPQIVTLAPAVAKLPTPTINETKLVPNISNVQTSKQQTNELPKVEVPNGNKTAADNADPTTDKTVEQSRVNISDDIVQILLIALICVTVIAITIGVLCRIDCCGMKTRCCRRSSSRATTQDRYEPNEEIPLNKV